MKPSIRTKAVGMLGEKMQFMTQTELRLMPYIQYCIVNEQHVDVLKINELEKNILIQWADNGWIEGGPGKIIVTEIFWNTMCALIYLGYVHHE